MTRNRRTETRERQEQKVKNKAKWGKGGREIERVEDGEGEQNGERDASLKGFLNMSKN